MASSISTPPFVEPAFVEPAEEGHPLRLRPSQPHWMRYLLPLASLKLTVALMAMSIFIVLAGTFAQVDADIWEVIHVYFRIDLSRLFPAHAPYFDPRELFVWVPAQLFFPPSFFPADPTFPAGLGWLDAAWPKNPQFQSWAGVWFPRGWTIGFVMMLNLFAAHLLRFKVQAKGAMLWGGVGALLVGIMVTTVVVLGGDSSDGVQGTPQITYDTLWKVMQFSLFALAAPAIYGAVASTTEKWGLRVLLSVVALILCGLGALSLSQDPFSDASMRILYQLAKGLLAATVLLVGCVMVFRKRAGIVLLHGGIGLIMAYEVLVGTSHVETQMIIPERETVNFSLDSREVELAFVDRASGAGEKHVVVAQEELKEGAKLTDPRLPFDVTIEKYIPNSDLKRASDKGNLATAGLGLQIEALPVAKSTGTDSNADFPAAYMKLTDRATGKDVGTYLLSTLTDPGMFGQPHVEEVSAGGKKYDVALRFVRHYKPYQVRLEDIQKNDYAGTTRPRDYRSIIDLTGPDGESVLREYPIWMNNPLRYAGETFYQSNWRMQDGREITTLQVVQNEGWMAPYVGCMIVLVGMLYQFGATLVRFIERRARGEVRGQESGVGSQEGAVSGQRSAVSGQKSEVGEGTGRLRGALVMWGVPALLAAFMVGSLVGSARPRQKVEAEFELAKFGDLPVIASGRALPMETLAQNRLMLISDKQSFVDKSGASHPAVHWLLDMIARPDVADTHPVFRIENDELAKSLGLKVNEKRTYAFADFKSREEDLRKQVATIGKLAKAERTVYQRKVGELWQRLTLYQDLRNWFADAGPHIDKGFPELSDPNASKNERDRAIVQVAEALRDLAVQSNEFQVPLVVPLNIGNTGDSISGILKRDWESYPVATGYLRLEQALDRAPPPAGAVKVKKLFDSWKAQQPQEFNAAVEDYRMFLASAKPEQLVKDTAVVSLPKSDFEAEYNRIAPFNLLSFAYLVVFVLTAASWLLWGGGFDTAARILMRSGWLTAIGLLAVHTAAIVGRIYISGRPPVTNLYSSAIFIGWGAVLLGIIAEGIFKLGFGNIAAAAAGFVTLRIAHGLASEGDTLGVVEAVLDTQFWLATHVVCITLGYAATYMAGLFGLIYVLGGAFTPALRDDRAKMLAKVTYGTLCAATMLSFVGTVLGGLWADDSWGRFWGWDPKENGALIIVMWNALVLHARWDGLARDRGVAALAVIGNVVTSWSWFGVNELGVGLHSYGFTEGRLLWLMAFCASQVVIAGLALLPRTWWWSGRAA